MKQDSKTGKLEIFYFVVLIIAAAYFGAGITKALFW